MLVTLKLKTAAVSAVAEVDRPQSGGAGCGRFFPDALAGAQRNLLPKLAAAIG
jgi:hypothetical protein